MVVEAKLTTTGMTAGKRYDVIRQGDMLIKDAMIKIVLDDGTIGLRSFSAFTVVNS